MPAMVDLKEISSAALLLDRIKVHGGGGGGGTAPGEGPKGLRIIIIEFNSIASKRTNKYCQSTFMSIAYFQNIIEQKNTR